MKNKNGHTFAIKTGLSIVLPILIIAFFFYGLGSCVPQPDILGKDEDEYDYTQGDVDFIVKWIGYKIDMSDVVSMYNSQLYSRDRTVYKRMVLTEEKSSEMYEDFSEMDIWENGAMPIDKRDSLLASRWPELENVIQKDDILWRYVECNSIDTVWCAVFDWQEDTLHFRLYEY